MTASAHESAPILGPKVQSTSTMSRCAHSRASITPSDSAMPNEQPRRRMGYMRLLQSLKGTVERRSRRELISVRWYCLPGVWPLLYVVLCSDSTGHERLFAIVEALGDANGQYFETLTRKGGLYSASTRIFSREGEEQRER